jgi:ribosome biogenesis GTPase
LSREFDYEEAFHDRDRKQWRKERKEAQDRDRSQFKKTDREEEKEVAIDLSWQKGRVVAITGEGIWIESNGARILGSLKGRFKAKKGEVKNLVAVGDIVHFTPEHAIAHIEKRYSSLSRTDITGKKEQLIAVNIDQVVIVVSLVNPPLKPSLIDRYLIAAAKGNLHPIIVINKIDLLEDDTVEQFMYREFLSAYEKLGIPILSVSTVNHIGIEALRSLLKDKVSVLSGQSGVGKSSLINASHGLTLRTGDLAQKTAKGSHTTTTAELLPLPGGGYCVDTPGVRSFGVWKLEKLEVVHHFHDFTQFPCKYPDCMHINEPDCGVLKAIEDEALSELRYESYRTLLNEALGKSDNRTKRKANYELD